MPPDAILFALLLASALVSAFVVGGFEERLAASSLLLASLVSPLVQSRAFAGPETGLLLVDSTLFAILAAIALRSRHFWPIWAAGFQLGGLAVHLAADRMPGMLPAAYAATLIIWSYPVVVTVLLGVLREGRRHRPV
ncbi:hypothetical protein [Thermaurantiacus sp.]